MATRKSSRSKAKPKPPRKRTAKAKPSPKPKHEIDQARLARVLGLTTRQIRNLEAQGLPHTASGNAKRYPLPDAVTWYAEFKFKREDLSPIQSAELRKKLADAENAEYNLAILRRDYIARTDVIAMLREPLDRVNAQLLNAPSRFAPRSVGLTTLPEALKVWQAAIDEMRGELRGLADEDLRTGPKPKGEADDGRAAS